MGGVTRTVPESAISVSGGVGGNGPRLVEADCSVTVGDGLVVHGTVEAVGRVQDYILLDSTHPTEKEDVRRSLARQLQAAEAKLAELYVVRSLEEWTEEDGPVLWWKFPVTEAPWVGTPHDLGLATRVLVDNVLKTPLDVEINIGGWPGYHTHWTRLPKIGPS